MGISSCNVEKHPQFLALIIQFYSKKGLAQDLRLYFSFGFKISRALWKILIVKCWFIEHAIH